MSRVSDCLYKLKHGDVIVYKTQGWVSDLIRYYGKTDYTHCAIYIGSSSNTIIESQWGGVQVSNVHKYDGLEYAVYRHINSTVKQKQRALKFCYSKLGKGYDFLGIIGLGLYKIGLDTYNSLDNNSRYWCSELIKDSYDKSGLELGIEKHSWKVTPDDLVKNKYMRLIISGNGV